MLPKIVKKFKPLNFPTGANQPKSKIMFQKRAHRRTLLERFGRNCKTHKPSELILGRFSYPLCPWSYNNLSAYNNMEQ